MGKVIAAAVAAAVFFLAIGTVIMAGVGMVAEGLNELHRWENGVAKMMERGVTV